MAFTLSPMLEEILFPQKLKAANEKASQQQMSHQRASTQTERVPSAGGTMQEWASNADDKLSERSSIYKATKDAITAPMRAYEGEFDVNSPYAVQEAMNTAGAAMLGGMPGGATGPGSVGMVRRALTNNYIRKIESETSNLYREVSGERFLGMFGGDKPFGAPREFYAEAPEMALGQGQNRGLRFKISTEGIEGRVYRGKPYLEEAWLKGAGEYEVSAQPSQILKNIKEIEVTKEAFNGLSRGQQVQLKNYLKRMEQSGVIVKRDYE